MIITSIRKRRSDAEIIFDDSSKLIVDYRIVFDNALRKNDEITEKRKNDLINQNEKLNVKDSAFRLLGRRQHSFFELKQKLIRRGNSKDIVELVLSDLRSNGYIDDLEFAKTFRDEKLKKRKSGLSKIKAGLFQKGVDSKIIEAVLEETDKTSSEGIAFELAEKKLHSVKLKENDQRKIRQKLSAYLFSKGFDGEIIRNVIDKLNQEEDEFSDL